LFHYKVLFEALHNITSFWRLALQCRTWPAQTWYSQTYTNYTDGFVKECNNIVCVVISTCLRICCANIITNLYATFCCIITSVAVKFLANNRVGVSTSTFLWNILLYLKILIHPHKWDYARSISQLNLMLPAKYLTCP